MLGHSSVILFFGRLLGALMLDRGAYENIEHDATADLQSMMVVVAVCAASGVAAMGLGLVGMAGFVTGVLVMLGAWIVWVATIATIGTISLAEPQTRSNVHELLRVLGYATAPGLFIALAAVRPAAPIVAAIVAAWIIAAAVVAVRQALDYRSTVRSAAVCIIAAAVSLGVMAGVAMLLARRVG